MKIYVTQTCEMVEPLIRALDELKISYSTVDVSQDLSAAAELRLLTDGNLSVPTILFDNGKHIIEPGPADLLAMFKAWDHAENAELTVFNNYIQRQYKYWLWLKVVPGFLIGLAFFAVGISVGVQIQMPPQSSILFFAVLLIFALLMLWPPIQKQVQKIQRYLGKIGISWLITYGFAFILGLFFTAASKVTLSGVGPWLMLGSLATPIIILLAYLSRKLWIGVQHQIIRLQRIITIVVIASMVIMMIVAVTAQRPELVRIASIPLPLVLGLTFLTSILQVSSGTPSLRPVANVSSLLGSGIGLILMGYLLLAL